MMGIFLLFFAVLIGAVIYQRHLSESRMKVFETVAKKTGLIVSVDGLLFRKPWLHGRRDGRQLDVSLFQKTESEITTKWIGYRVHFQNAVTRGPTEQETAEERFLATLSGEFRECRIDEERLFCARESAKPNEALLVRDIEFVLRAAKRWEEESQTALAESSFVVPVPQPVLDRPERSANKPRVEPPPLPLSKTDREEGIVPAVPVAASVPVVEVVSQVPRKPVQECAKEDLVLSPLCVAAIALAGSGLSHYEAGREFDARYLGQLIEGVGTLRKVEPFSNDRVYGRGPGLLARCEIRATSPETALPIGMELFVELPQPDESGMVQSDWRRWIGEDVLVCGTAIRFDAFTKRLFLRDGLVEMKSTSTSTSKSVPAS